MPTTIHQIGPDQYPRYADIDAGFDVVSLLKVVPKDNGFAGLAFVEERLEHSYRMEADCAEDSPLLWPPKDETGEFAVFLAAEGDLPVGGAAVIVSPSAAFLFERRDTLAGLWDIRVHPEHRGRGVGSILLLHAADWAKARGCTQMRIECQNTNVSACRFYAKYCTLGGVERFG